MPDIEKTSCSFCLKPVNEVSKLIEGPGTHICDECVAVCVEILSNAPESSDGPDLPSWTTLDDDQLLARLPRMGVAARQVEGALHQWVAEGRRRGLSWERIGTALDMTRQSAWERFSHSRG
ncbi:ClpX C4-type zinc finger protein [Nocardioides korecus]